MSAGRTLFVPRRHQLAGELSEVEIWPSPAGVPANLRREFIGKKFSTVPPVRL